MTMDAAAVLKIRMYTRICCQFRVLDRCKVLPKDPSLHALLQGKHDTVSGVQYIVMPQKVARRLSDVRTSSNDTGSGGDTKFLQKVLDSGVREGIHIVDASQRILAMLAVSRVRGGMTTLTAVTST